MHSSQPQSQSFPPFWQYPQQQQHYMPPPSEFDSHQIPVFIEPLSQLRLHLEHQLQQVSAAQYQMQNHHYIIATARQQQQQQQQQQDPSVLQSRPDLQQLPSELPLQQQVNSQMQPDIGLLQQRLRYLKEHAASAKKDFAKRLGFNQQLIQELKEELSATKARHSDDLSERDATLELMQEELTTTTAQRNRLEADLREMTSNLESISRLRVTEVSAMKAELTGVQQQKQIVEENLHNQLNLLSGRLSQTQRDKDQLELRLSAEISKLTSQITQEVKPQTDEENVSETSSSSSATSNKLESLDKELRNSNSRLHAQQQEFKKLKRQAEKLRTTNEKLETDNETLKSELTICREDRSKEGDARQVMILHLDHVLTLKRQLVSQQYAYRANDETLKSIITILSDTSESSDSNTRPSEGELRVIKLQKCVNTFLSHYAAEREILQNEDIASIAIATTTLAISESILKHIPSTMDNRVRRHTENALEKVKQQICLYSREHARVKSAKLLEAIQLMALSDATCKPSASQSEQFGDMSSVFLQMRAESHEKKKQQRRAKFGLGP